MKEPITFNIKIYVYDSPDVKLLKLVKKYTNKSYKEIKENIVNCKPIHSILLKSSSFYVGIDQLILFIHELIGTSISYAIACDETKLDFSDLLEIQNKLKNMSLEDFR